MKVNLDVGFKARFGYKLLDKYQNVKLEGEFDNALLDSFFNHLRSVAEPMQSAVLKLGTGSTPVANNQTGLANVLTGVDWFTATNIVPNESFQDGSLLKMSTVYSWLFPLGSVIANLSEVGVSFVGIIEGNTTNTRALVVDNLGNPTTIPVTAEDQLLFTYTLYAQSSINDNVGSVNGLINGVPSAFTVTTRWGLFSNLSSYVSSSMGLGNNAAVYNGDLNPIGEYPGGTYDYSTFTTLSFNVSGGKEKTFIFSTDVANLAGGITVFTPAAVFPVVKLHFNPAIEKTNARQFTITMRQTFSRL